MEPSNHPKPSLSLFSMASFSIRGFLELQPSGKTFLYLFISSLSRLKSSLSFLASVSYVHSAPALASLCIYSICVVKHFQVQGWGTLFCLKECCKMSSTRIGLCSEQEAEWPSAGGSGLGVNRFGCSAVLQDRPVTLRRSQNCCVFHLSTYSLHMQCFSGCWGRYCDVFS